jgi:hypothetical protein
MQQTQRGELQSHMMTPAANSLAVSDFQALTLGLVVYFAGVIVTRNVAFLRQLQHPGAGDRRISRSGCLVGPSCRNRLGKSAHV